MSMFRFSVLFFLLTTFAAHATEDRKIAARYHDLLYMGHAPADAVANTGVQCGGTDWCIAIDTADVSNWQERDELGRYQNRNWRFVPLEGNGNPRYRIEETTTAPHHGRYQIDRSLHHDFEAIEYAKFACDFAKEQKAVIAALASGANYTLPATYTQKLATQTLECQKVEFHFTVGTLFDHWAENLPGGKVIYGFEFMHEPYVLAQQYFIEHALRADAVNAAALLKAYWAAGNDQCVEGNYSHKWFCTPSPWQWDEWIRLDAVPGAVGYIRGQTAPAAPAPAPAADDTPAGDDTAPASDDDSN